MEENEIKLSTLEAEKFSNTYTHMSLGQRIEKQRSIRESDSYKLLGELVISSQGHYAYQ